MAYFEVKRRQKLFSNIVQKCKKCRKCSFRPLFCHNYTEGGKKVAKSLNDHPVIHDENLSVDRVRATVFRGLRCRQTGLQTGCRDPAFYYYCSRHYFCPILTIEPRYLAHRLLNIMRERSQIQPDM